jgi:hypothetical protein
MEDNLKKNKMEDDLKKKMEDKLKIFLRKTKNNLNFFSITKMMTSKKWKMTSKKYLKKWKTT